jgi:hypothetical protein
MDLQQELKAVEQMAREKTPPHVMPTIEASIHAVKESGLERRALQPGETIRDFELPDATGAMVNRGAWCSILRSHTSGFSGVLFRDCESRRHARCDLSANP